MIELLAIPNILAQFMSSLNKAFYANLIYSIGYIPFIWHNIKIGDPFQIKYFSLLEVLAVSGVIWHLWKNRKTIVFND